MGIVLSLPELLCKMAQSQTTWPRESHTSLCKPETSTHIHSLCYFQLRLWEICPLGQESLCELAPG